MPMSALLNGEEASSDQFTGKQWKDLREQVSTGASQITMSCCDAPGILKRSRLGTQFFAHKGDAEGCGGLESPEHLYAKGVILNAAREMGWIAEVEVRGTTADGEVWIADILCKRKSAKVAFEIQLTSQTLDTLEARQKRYEESEIRCCWLVRSQQFRNLSWKLCFHKSQFLPVFSLSVDDPKKPIVQLPNSREEMRLDDFVRGVLSRKLKWIEPVPEFRKVKLYASSVTCWNCDVQIKWVHGYFDVESDERFRLHDLKAKEGMQDLVDVWRQRDADVTPVSVQERTKRFAASCPHCKTTLRKEHARGESESRAKLHYWYGKLKVGYDKPNASWEFENNSGLTNIDRIVSGEN